MFGVTAKLGLDGSGFEKGLAKAGQQMGAFAAGPVGELKTALAGAFSVGALKSLIDFGSKIKDTSQRLDMTTDSVQELSFAAGQNGSSLDEVARGIEHLAKGQEAILEGGEKAEKMIRIFQQLGFSLEEINSLSPEEKFRKLGTALQDVNIAGRIQAGLFDLMGKGAGKLVATLKELNANIAEIRASGGIITNEEIERMDKWGDELTKAELILKVWASRAGQFIAEAAAGAGTASVTPNEKDIATNVMSKAKATELAIANKNATGTERDQFMDFAEKFFASKDSQRKGPAAAASESPFADKPIRAIGPQSDSLLSTGNFLGASGRNVMESTTKQMAADIREMTKTNAAIKSVIERFSFGGFP